MSYVPVCFCLEIEPLMYRTHSNHLIYQKKLNQTRHVLILIFLLGFILLIKLTPFTKKKSLLSCTIAAFLEMHSVINANISF